MNNFYLIDSIMVHELNQSQKDILNKYLTIYHTHSSSFIDKAEAIYALVDKDGIEKLRFEYTAWLFDFVNYHLKSIITEKETEVLEKILANCYNILGFKNEIQGKVSQALDSFKKALKIFKKLNDTEGIFQSYNQIGLFYDSRGDLSNALKFHEKCAKIGRQLEDKGALARFYNNITVVLKNQGNFLKALEYLYKALSIQEEINDEEGIAISYHSIGLSLFSQHELDDALKYFLAALKLYQKIGSERDEAYVYVHIGSIYNEKGEADIALEYYIKALNLNFPEMWEIYLKMGKVYENKNQIDLALHYYNKALQMSEKGEFKETLSSALIEIGSLEIKKGNIKEANKHIEKAFALAQELKYPKLIMEAASIKVQLAVEKEDYKLAYEMESLKNEMKDKLQNQQAQKAIIKHQIKYEYEKQLKQKDEEIELEKKNKRFIEEQVDILTAKNQQLASKNKIINEQLSEKDRLTQKFPEKNNGIYNSN